MFEKYAKIKGNDSEFLGSIVVVTVFRFLTLIVTTLSTSTSNRSSRSFSRVIILFGISFVLTLPAISSITSLNKIRIKEEQIYLLIKSPLENFKLIVTILTRLTFQNFWNKMEWKNIIDADA
jgi:hypothetical protein